MSSPSTPASNTEEPTFGGLTLSAYAEASAYLRVYEQVDRATALAQLGMSDTRFSEADAAWAVAIEEEAERGEAELVVSFAAEMRERIASFTDDLQTPDTSPEPTSSSMPSVAGPPPTATPPRAATQAPSKTAGPSPWAPRLTGASRLEVGKAVVLGGPAVTAPSTTQSPTAAAAGINTTAAVVFAPGTFEEALPFDDVDDTVAPRRVAHEVDDAGTESSDLDGTASLVLEPGIFDSPLPFASTNSADEPNASAEGKEGPKEEGAPCSSVPSQVAIWTLEHYASFCAETAAYPDRTRAILHRYRLDRAALVILESQFRSRFASNSADEARFQSLFKTYLTYVRSSG